MKRPASEDSIADRRRGEAAAQLVVSYAAGVEKWSERRAHSDQSLPRTRCGGVRGAEALDALQPLRMCPPGQPSGERGSILPVWTPGRLFGEQGSILCSLSRIRGTGILQVSRHETLEKPDNRYNYCRPTMPMQGFRHPTVPIDYCDVTAARQ